jgi:organic radical activating enzyme
MAKQYSVTEMFYAPQGEGRQTGLYHVFVRFAGCNLDCRHETVGFDCDTDFSNGMKMTCEEIVRAAKALAPQCHRILFTGGEPGLQLDRALVSACHADNYYITVETNGTVALPEYLNWVCVSPKSAAHTLRIRESHPVVDELKYVLHAGQAAPKPSLEADHYLLSPAFSPDGTLSRDNLAWCLEIAKRDTRWGISTQMHKLWRSR